MALITEERIEAALHFLATTSEDIAAARAQRLRAEFRRKRVKAELLRKANESNAQLREAWAESHPDYAQACEDECDAVQRDEFLRDRRNGADSVVSAWQTEQATARAGATFR